MWLGSLPKAETPGSVATFLPGIARVNDMKSIWERLKRSLYLDDSTSVDAESRRRFIKGAAGLAAIAAIPVGISGGFQLLSADQKTALAYKIKSGQVIENVTFMLDRPIILKNVSNILIRNCRFIASPDFVGNEMIFIDSGCEGLVIRDSIFDAPSFGKKDQVAMRFSGIQPSQKQLNFRT